MKLIIHPDASADIQEETNYYEAVQADLGVAFLDEVDAAIDTVLDMPEAFLIRRTKIRMFVSTRLPFCLLYRVNGTSPH